MAREGPATSPPPLPPTPSNVQPIATSDSDGNRRYVVIRNKREASGISKAQLVAVVKAGELLATDEIWDSNKNQMVNTQKLIQKYKTS